LTKQMPCIKSKQGKIKGKQRNGSEQS
jgi:hypothetical protein